LPGEELSLTPGKRTAEKVQVAVCVGTSCYLKGSQTVLTELLRDVREQNLEGKVDVKGAFCLERCGRGPNAVVGGRPVSGLEATRELLQRVLVTPRFGGGEVAIDLAASSSDEHP